VSRTAEQMFSSRRRSPDALGVQLEQVLDGIRQPRTPGSGRPGVEEAIAGSCDCCPAAAAVRVRMPSGSVLMLCGHHGRRHAPALRVQRAEVTGELAFAARSRQTSS